MLVNKCIKRARTDSGEMRISTESLIDEFHTIVYPYRQLKDKRKSFVKKGSKFTGNLRKIGIFRFIRTL
jgi:hypothetical protein